MAPKTPQPPQTKQPIQKFWAFLLESEAGTSMMEGVLKTHAPEPDGRKLDVQHMLRIIENIVHRANRRIVNGPRGTHDEALRSKQDKGSLAGSDGNLKAQLAFVINKVSHEMVWNCSSGGGDLCATTEALFATLSKYSWDAKVVLTVAAFAVNYGEFSLFIPLYFKENPLAVSVALLKQLPDIKKYAKLLESKANAITELVEAIMRITQSIVKLNDLLTSGSVETDQPEMSTAMDFIAKAACWIIYNVVVCATVIACLNGYQQYSTVESWDLWSLVSEGSEIETSLKGHLAYCLKQMEANTTNYRDLVNIFRKPPDNIKILAALLGTQQIVIGTKKDEQISIEVLRGQNVLLLISGLDLTKQEITTLGKFYEEAQNGQEALYKVVWLPVVEKSTPWNKKNKNSFEELQQMMSWYTVPDPSKIKPEVIKYIQEKWHFTKKMMLVPIDPKGRVQSLNALDMLWIWGNLAFPFTDDREESLCEDQKWEVLELLLGGFNQTILNWIREGEIVCFYGGDDINWIRKFNLAAKKVVEETAATGISFQFVYMGKKKAIKQVDEINRVIESIGDLNRNGYWADPATSIWFFWTRMDAIVRSKVQRGKNVDNEIMRWVTTLLTFDGSWVMFCRGWSEMAKAEGEIVLPIMTTDFEKWKDNIKSPNDFLPELSKNFPQSEKESHCYHLTIPGDGGDIPEIVSCAECGRTMERLLMYRCCVE